MRRVTIGRASIAVAGVLATVACAPLLGLDDYHDDTVDAAGADARPDLPDAAPDVDTDAGDGGPARDADAEAGPVDPCEFAPVTSASVVDNPDYPSFPMPNTSLKNQASFEDVGADVVRDKVTGLRWRKAPGPQGAQSVARAYCSGLGPDAGPQAWRLPTRIELASILYYKNLNGDGVVPPPCAYSSLTVNEGQYLYWTTTPVAGSTDEKYWGGVFSSCGMAPYYAPDYPSMQVRCVQGERKTPRFEVSTKCKIVRDLNARIEWQQDFERIAKVQEGASSNALTYCATLGKNDSKRGESWLVPTQTELFAMVDSTRVSPAVSLDLFPGTPASGAIVSQTRNGATNYAALQLETGEQTGVAYSAPAIVRCVRYMTN